MSHPTLSTGFPDLSGPILAIEEYLATDDAPVLVRVQVDDPIRGPIIEMYFADDLMVQE